MTMTQEQLDALLRRLGGQPDQDIDLAQAALALGALDRPDVDLAPYQVHLDVLAEDARQAVTGADDLAARVAALNDVMFQRYRYHGDTESYDDLDNANLLSVIDRKRGLPIALSIVYIATARALGWRAIGVNFPGHFLVRLDAGGGSALVDPFNGGAVRDSADLRALLKGLQGAEAELRPEHYAPRDQPHDPLASAEQHKVAPGRRRRFRARAGGRRAHGHDGAGRARPVARAAARSTPASAICAPPSRHSRPSPRWRRRAPRASRPSGSSARCAAGSTEPRRHLSAAPRPSYSRDPDHPHPGSRP